ncbi:hypothetical protein K3495_g10148 [Podosphaera aphanis]|nr:hypothetical protein K3495_g10148 [Podosphaera aphanis]
MPRIPQSLIAKAHNKSPLLPLILRATRTLPSAINELRWLKEHVKDRNLEHCKNKSKILVRFVKRRARGEPLQYILGSQPFGNLDIKCKRGVLIPRPETEAYTLHLANLIKRDKLHQSITRIYSHPGRTIRGGTNQKIPKLRILDACSGSGAIALLLRSALRKATVATSEIFVLGLDNSAEAIALANQNRDLNVELSNLPPSALPGVQFKQRDIFEPLGPNELMWDIIISNPPYISHEAFDKETSPSVRNYEPKSALVPRVPKVVFGIKERPEDIFYHRLIELHDFTFSKVLLMEVGDVAQAIRVAKISLDNARVGKHSRVELWRDNPGAEPDPKKVTEVDIEGVSVRVKGVGKVRSVVLIRIDDGKPQAGKDYLIKRLKFKRLYIKNPMSETPKPQVYGPPELKATWKLLNSPVGTEGRATRAMAKGWGSQTKSREKIKARKTFDREAFLAERKQAITAFAELGKPAIAQAKKMKKNNRSENDIEPFLVRPKPY